MDANTVEKKKRPGWVWAISIFFVISAVYTLLSFYLIYSGRIPLQPAQKAYFASLTVFDLGVSFLSSFLIIIAAVQLFCLRKQAFYFFVGVFAANVLITLWHIVTKGFVEALPSGAMAGVLTGWAIQIAICFYVKRLERLGILH